MNRVFCLVGKSCSGKDTLYARILERCPELVPVVPCTTRPMRPGEVEGQSYHFVTQEQLRQYENQGQVIEKREYHTTQGLWTYFTLRFDLDTDRLLITTLAGARALMDCYGPGHVRVVYLHVDDRTRLLRYIDRESRQARPDYTDFWPTRPIFLRSSWTNSPAFTGSTPGRRWRSAWPGGMRCTGWSNPSPRRRIG